MLVEEEETKTAKASHPPLPPHHHHPHLSQIAEILHVSPPLSSKSTVPLTDTTQKNGYGVTISYNLFQNKLELYFETSIDQIDDSSNYTTTLM